MLHKLNHLTSIIGTMARKLILPYQFSCLRGHNYLTYDQIGLLYQNLQTPYNQSVVELYENKVGAIIGSGRVVSFASGRMAFYALLQALEVGKNDEVLLTGFTCAVMVNAVWRTGATPVFADISLDTFGTDPEDVEKKITSKTKVIVAQHSFGIPCRIDEIAQIGKKYGIIVIEDCALTFDSSYKGTTAGNWGDAAVFSTDHSKPLNTLIGGFSYTKNNELSNRVQEIQLQSLSLDSEHQQNLVKQIVLERDFFEPRQYPRKAVFAQGKRLLSGRGRPSVFLDKDFSSTVTEHTYYPYPAQFPAVLAQLGLFEIERWKMEQKVRRQILAEYIDIVRQKGLQAILPQAYFDKDFDITPLRFVLADFKLDKALREKENFDSSWTWFRQPIIGYSGDLKQMGYEQGKCPTSESVGKIMTNWPVILYEEWRPILLRLFNELLENALVPKN